MSAAATVLELRQRRCVNHPQREASARCPECGRFYCRECVTEHDDRVVCAACLARLTRKKEKSCRAWALVPRLLLALLAFAFVYAVVMLLGNGLLAIPSHFHAKGGW
ncbi:MAG: rhomboid family protein [Verrucomicrobiota bacterium]